LLFPLFLHRMEERELRTMRRSSPGNPLSEVLTHLNALLTDINLH
jgi:hypothetical protein